MGAGTGLIPKLIFQILVMLTVFGAILFGAAGTMAWASAWAFLAAFGAVTLVVSLWLAWVDPALLAERLKPPVQLGQKAWDRLFIAIVAMLFLAWLALMAIDARRYAWTYLPEPLQWLGLLLLILSYAGIAWVFSTNSFAAPVIKMQQERKQAVITTGPYAVVRHPMYGFGFFVFSAVPLMLGSLWGLAALPVMGALLHLRTLGEEKMLRAELAGYEDYARRVRWRYAPGIW